MDRPLIAAGACAPEAPLVYCPPVEPTAYDFEIFGQLYEDLFDLGPTLVLSTTAALDPQPVSLDLTFELAMPITPISSPPTQDEVPTSWQTVYATAGDPAGEVSVFLPLTQLPFAPGTPFWLRVSITDEKGCVTQAVAALPNGLPESWEDPVTVYLSLNDAAFIQLDVPGGGDPSDPIPFEDFTGECPPPTAALAVKPACEFPVQVDGIEFPDSIEVSGPDGGPVVAVVFNPTADEEPVPLVVELAEPEPLPIGYQGVAAVDGLVPFEGVRWAVIRRTDAGLDATDVKIYDDATSAFGINLAGGQSFEFPFSPDHPFRFDVIAVNAATVQVAYR